MQEARRDTGLLAVRMVKEMMKYRNSEITALSKTLKKGIISLHRKHSIEQHTAQATELNGIVEQISLFIDDTDFDIYHLHFCRTHGGKSIEYSTGNAKKESSRDLHYIQ